MNAIAPLPSRDPWGSPSYLLMVRRGPFKSCNEQEFDEAVSVAKTLGLDPIRREIYAFVFNANKPDKRNMVLVTGIMGYRKIAARHGNYRPGPCTITVEDAAVNPKTNPRGIVSARATVFFHSHGEWHEVTEEVTWSSYAPIKTKVWSDQARGLVDMPADQWHLDPTKEAWSRQGDVMLKKCAEAQAIRRAWPADLSRLYIDEEIERTRTIDAEYADLTPSATVEAIARAERLDAIGGHSITMDPMDGSNALVGVPAGKLADWCLSRLEALPPTKAAEFQDRNRRGLQELWAHSKGDALAVKKEIEKRIAAAPKAPPTAPAEGEPIRETETAGEGEPSW